MYSEKKHIDLFVRSWPCFNRSMEKNCELDPDLVLVGSGFIWVRGSGFRMWRSGEESRFWPIKSIRIHITGENPVFYKYEPNNLINAHLRPRLRISSRGRRSRITTSRLPSRPSKEKRDNWCLVNFNHYNNTNQNNMVKSYCDYLEENVRERYISKLSNG